MFLLLWRPVSEVVEQLSHELRVGSDPANTYGVGPNLGRCWPTLGQIRPHTSKGWPVLANLSQSRPNIAKDLAGVGQRLADFDHPRASLPSSGPCKGQASADIGQHRSHLAKRSGRRVWGEFGCASLDALPNLARLRPNSGEACAAIGLCQMRLDPL